MDNIPTEVIVLSQRIAHAGGQAYLVGGCVRDMIQGIKPKDFDMEVFKLPKETLKEVLGGDLDEVGESFGVFKLRNGIDVALPRREVKIGNGHSDFKVIVDIEMSFEEAAKRRDFTVNAIGYDPLVGVYVDPYDGISHINRGLLKMVNPKVFHEDPLRVLRGFKFVSRYGWDFNFKTALAMHDTLKSLANLSKERVTDEWREILQGQYVTKAMRWMNEIDLFLYWPTTTNFYTDREGLVDALSATDHIQDPKERLFLNLCILADMSGNEQGFFRQFSFNDKLVKRVLKTIEMCMGIGVESTDGQIRSLSRECAPATLNDLADYYTILFGSEKHLEDNIETAYRLHISDVATRSLLTGEDILALGITEGAEIGTWLKTVDSLWFQDKISTKEEAIEFITFNRIINTSKEEQQQKVVVTL